MDALNAILGAGIVVVTALELVTGRALARGRRTRPAADRERWTTFTFLLIGLSLVLGAVGGRVVPIVAWLVALGGLAAAIYSFQVPGRSKPYGAENPT